jgi:hypothetical protein
VPPVGTCVRPRGPNTLQLATAATLVQGQHTQPVAGTACSLELNDRALDRPVSRRSRYLPDMGDELRNISPQPDGLEDLAERIAGRVAEILADSRSLDTTQNEWLTAGQLAARLGVTAQWVYDHQNELGAIKLGSGRKPRLRFPGDTTPGTDHWARHRPRPEGHREPRRTRAGLLPVYDD